jgi:transglutaminase-like putative cysteine protease
MKHAYLLVFFLLVLTASSGAQDFDYGKITGSDFELKNTVLDSNANAMVIREFGTSSMQLDDATHNLCIYFRYHVKLKIFNKNGFGSGNVVIPRSVYRDGEDEVSELTATTTNLVNGRPVKYELDKKSVFNEKKNKYYAVTKFTMPNLTEGSIVEYSYSLKQPSIFNFRGWDFQSDIPKLYSEYVANIPALYNYNASLRGFKKLTSSKSAIKRECLRIQGGPYDCSQMTYIMKDIPAFIEEDYMTAASNFRSAIYYELSDYHMVNGGKKAVTKTWKDVDYELLSDKSFGDQMKKKDVFKDLLAGILKDASDSLGKAQAIYTYIAKNIKATNEWGIFGESNIKKALEMHSGSVKDINLALIACLSAAGLDAEALILSTRNNGTVNNLYPVLSDFNYVVAKLNIGDRSYLLDASQPRLPFGLLPLHCINGNGRAIPFKKPSYWYDIKASQKDFTMYALDAEITPEGKIKGRLTTTSSGYAALMKRERISQANSVDEFVEKLDEQMPAISILKHHIANVDSIEESLVEEYQIEMKAFDNMNLDQLFFNPFFIDRISKNPFNLNERTYPVDLGSLKEVRIMSVIRLPDNFSIADKPKDFTMVLTDNGGKYQFKSTQEGKTLAYNQLFQLSKPIYGPDEYLGLKEFYSRIIQLQKTDVVIKKQSR